MFGIDSTQLNHELKREQKYYIEALAETNVLKLNQQHDTLIETVNSGSGEIFFLDTLGGTGKMFLISLLFGRIRLQMM